HRHGRRLPSKGPPGELRPLEALLSPSPLALVPPPTAPLVREKVRLVRGETPARASALVLSLLELERWASRATTARLASRRAALAYFHLPASYGRELGALRWTPNGEAIERADGTTYALAAELAPLVEGFLAGGRVVHLAHVLHFLGYLKEARGDATAALRDAF